MSSRRSTLFAGLLTLIATTVEAAPVPVTINASTAIYNADNPNAVQAGVPIGILLPTATTNFTFTLGVPGQTITVNGGQDFTDADGNAVTSLAPALVKASTVPPTSANPGTATLSGIKSFGAGYITAVFLGASPVAKPAGVDYTQVGTNLSSYAPALQQVFYVGDGLTGDGSGALQTFFVPTGAVMLYLGISESAADGQRSPYADNFGSFAGSLTFSTRAVPEPATAALLAVGLLAGALRRRRR